MTTTSLSKHFTIGEFIASSTGARHGIDNTPPDALIPELMRTAELLEQVRTLINSPIIVTSGYRCSALNKLIGGKATSKHVQGLACDFKAPQFGDPMRICKWIRDSEIVFGKLILEYYEPNGGGWVHIQVGAERKVLTINKHGTFAGLQP